MRDPNPQPFMLTVIGWSVAALLCLLALFGSVLLQKPVPDRRAVNALATQDLEQFAKVVPGRTLQFPQDYGTHDDFRQEWWYVTANLEDASGKQFGVQWTLFRLAMNADSSEGWKDSHIFMAHAVVTTESGVYYAERFSRGGIGQAGVQSAPFNAWLDNWQWLSEGEGPFPARLMAADSSFAFDLNMNQTLPEVLQGDAGYSQKHGEKEVASYYFSVPALALSGSLTVNGQTYSVTGKGWLDREWSTQALSEDQSGWDWFSMHLDDGRALMVVQVRSEHQPHRFGSLTDSEGNNVILDNDAIDLVPISFDKMPSGRHLPVKWQIQVPAHGISITTKPLHQKNWLPLSFPYWEGPILIDGSSKGKGFMEATGY